jgi:glycine cleavage system aminomethyltransferase T
MAKKKDFIGRLMKERPALVDPQRPIVVGVRPVDKSDRLRAGSHFIGVDVQPGPDTDEGYLTSVAFSPVLGQWIGIGLLKNGAQRHGERVRAYDPVRNGDVIVEICAPCFVDPKEEKLRV